MDSYFGVTKKELRVSWYHQIINQVFSRETAQIALSIFRSQKKEKFLRENLDHRLIEITNCFYSDIMKNHQDFSIKDFLGINGLKLFTFLYQHIPKDTQNFEKLSARRDCLDELVKFCYVCGIIKSIPHYIFDKEHKQPFYYYLTSLISFIYQ